MFWVLGLSFHICVSFTHTWPGLCCRNSPSASSFPGPPDCESYMYPCPKRQILDPSKLKEFADDKFKFDENSRKFSKWLEDTVGKGEIARYEQFLLFPLCFQNTCTADT